MRFFSQWPSGPSLPAHSSICRAVEMTKRKATDGDKLAKVAEMMEFFTRDENKAYIQHNKRMRLQVSALRQELNGVREELIVVSDHRDGLDNECFRLEGELMEKEYQINELRESLRRAQEHATQYLRWMDNLKKANQDLADVMKLALPHVPSGVLPHGTPMLVQTQIPFAVSVQDAIRADEEDDGYETQLESSEIVEESSSDESEILWRQDFNREREDV